MEHEQTTSQLTPEEIEGADSEEILKKMKEMESEAKAKTTILNPQHVLEDIISEIDPLLIVDLGMHQQENDVKKIRITPSSYQEKKLKVLEFAGLQSKETYRRIAAEHLKELPADEKIAGILEYKISEYESSIVTIRSRNEENKQNVLRHAKEKQESRKKMNLYRSLAYKIKEEITSLQKQANEYKNQLREKADSQIEEQRVTINLTIQEKENTIYELGKKSEAEIGKYKNAQELTHMYEQSFQEGLSQLTEYTKRKDTLDYYKKIHEQNQQTKSQNKPLHKEDYNVFKNLAGIIEKGIVRYESSIQEQTMPRIYAQSTSKKDTYIDTQKELEKIEKLHKEMNKL